MPVLTDRQSVAANTTIANAMSGKTDEFLRGRSVVKLFATASAVGMLYTLLVGGQAFLEDQEVNAQNRMPLIPDDFVVAAGGMPGDRIVVKLHNTTAGAITAFTRVEISPV